MARVFIPVAMRSLVGGQESVEASGLSIGQIIDQLEQQFPGMRERLCDGEQLRPGLAVAVNGSVSALGLLQRVASDAEIHFLPAIGGG